jgi:hypothetical protein
VRSAAVLGELGEQPLGLLAEPVAERLEHPAGDMLGVAVGGPDGLDLHGPVLQRGRQVLAQQPDRLGVAADEDDVGADVLGDLVHSSISLRRGLVRPYPAAGGHAGGCGAAGRVGGPRVAVAAAGGDRYATETANPGSGAAGGGPGTTREVAGGARAPRQR